MRNRNEKIEKIRKLIDKLAYLSLILDISIATISSLILLGVQNSKFLLLPISHMLSFVVFLSISLFVVLLWFKHQEKILDLILQRRYKYIPENSLRKKVRRKIQKFWRKIKWKEKFKK